MTLGSLLGAAQKRKEYRSAVLRFLEMDQSSAMPRDSVRSAQANCRIPSGLLPLWVKNGSVPARAACPFDPQEQTSSGYKLRSGSCRSQYFAPQNTAHYSIVRSTMAPQPLSASNRRGIVRFGDQHHLGGHRSWT